MIEAFSTAHFLFWTLTSITLYGPFKEVQVSSSMHLQIVAASIHYLVSKMLSQF